MRTTVRLNDALLEQAKAEAARRGQTLTSFIELGLRLALAQSKNEEPRKRVELPISSARGGPRPGINIEDNSQLEDLMWEGFKE